MDIPSDKIKSGGILFWGDRGETRIKRIYHIIARGNNKEYIFKEGIDKGYFIKLLKGNIAGMNYRLFCARNNAPDKQ